MYRYNPTHLGSAGSAYHVRAVDWSGHLYLPEVLAVRHRLSPADRSRTAAVADVEAGIPSVIR